MSTTRIIGASSYSNWDFYNNHISPDLAAGQFISSESSLVAAGWPDLENASIPRTKKSTTANKVTTTTYANQVYPIGLLETIGIQQSKQIQRIFEIGSARSYFIPGRVIGSFNLGRTFFNGVSLLRALYAYVTAVHDDDLIMYPLLADLWTAVPDATNAKDVASLEGTGLNSAIDYEILRRNPGYNDFLIDMTSDLFSRPFGLAIYAKDNFGNISHSFYLENCYLQGHQISISSGSLLIMEGSAAQFERAVPIKMVTLEEGGGNLPVETAL